LKQDLDFLETTKTGKPYMPYRTITMSVFVKLIDLYIIIISLTNSFWKHT